MSSLIPHQHALPAAAAIQRINKANTRVLIADNHALVRRGLAALVNAEDDMVSCGAFACDEEAMTAVVCLRPDVVIIDASVSRGAGLTLIQRIRKLDANIRIVALAMNDRPEVVDRIFSAGAAEFVIKSELAERVLDAVRRSAAARSRGDESGARAGNGAGHPAPRAERGLDATERAIVEMIGRGVPTRAIAIRLGVSVSAVEACRRRIRSKLNFPTATQLVHFCVRWAERSHELVAQK